MSDDAALAEARRAFEACGSLSSAIRAGLALSPEWMVIEVVVQDEFTHDVIFQAAPGGPAILLDCT